jgi:acyl-coenzyme A synthetase/AMP-(fatty) acid ligase
LSAAALGSDALWDAARRAGTRHRDQEALVGAEGSVSRGSLLDGSERLARELSALGLSRGGIVVVALPSGVDFVSTVLALWRLGHAVAMGSSAYGPAEGASIVDGIGPCAIICGARGAGAWVRGQADPVLPIGTGTLHQRAVIVPLAASVTRPDIALIKFSSGSTGVPKAIALNADNVLAESRAVVETLRLDGADRVFCPVPVHHSYGFDLGVLPMLAGAACLVLASPPVPRRFWSDLAAHRATVCLGIPNMYRLALRLAPATRAETGPLRWLLSCTAPLSAEFIRDFHHRFGAALCQHYGSSETGAVTTQHPLDAVNEPGAVGRAMHGVDLKTVDEAGQPVPDGVAGRVLVRGPAVARGYLMGAPTGMSPFVRPDTFLMGDRGTLRNGLLSLHGRADDLINVGGLKVSPAEVVATLESHPAVLEAGATGVTDAFGEQHVYAAVVLAAAATEEELLRHCRGRLAEHKIPRRIDVRDHLPHGPSGKVRLDAKDVTQ